LTLANPALGQGEGVIIVKFWSVGSGQWMVIPRTYLAVKWERKSDFVPSWIRLCYWVTYIFRIELVWVLRKRHWFEFIYLHFKFLPFWSHNPFYFMNPNNILQIQQFQIIYSHTLTCIKYVWIRIHTIFVKKKSSLNFVSHLKNTLVFRTQIL
jgi:hypothetical protein